MCRLWPALILAAVTPANACGWTRTCINRFVPHVHCAVGRETLTSWYAPDGKITSSGKRYGGMAAAARTWPLGTHLSLFNPRNNRRVNIVITDRGPYGAAFEIGARLDLQNEPADALGGRDTRYICVSE